MFKKLIISIALSSLSSFALADVFVIDVRTADEFAIGHLEQALNIEHQKILDGVIANNIKPEDQIYVYCRSGKRAEFAKNLLNQNGYNDVTNLGGYEEAKKFFETQK